MKKGILINIPFRSFWRYILPGTIIVCIVAIISGIVIVDRVIMPRIVGVNRT